MPSRKEAPRDFARQDLEDVTRHIAEAQRRIEDLHWRIASLEQAGADPSPVKEYLRRFEEVLADLSAHRDVILREMAQSS